MFTPLTVPLTGHCDRLAAGSSARDRYGVGAGRPRYAVIILAVPDVRIGARIESGCARIGGLTRRIGDRDARRAASGRVQILRRRVAAGQRRGVVGQRDGRTDEVQRLGCRCRNGTTATLRLIADILKVYLDFLVQD